MAVRQRWTAYGDSQLDALIGEALADAPDLAKAVSALAEPSSNAPRPWGRTWLRSPVAEVKQSYNAAS
jgi:hypothetical protein